MNPQSNQPVKKRSWLYEHINTSYKVVIATASLGVIAVVLAMITGFWGGLTVRTFKYFYQLTGA